MAQGTTKNESNHRAEIIAGVLAAAIAFVYLYLQTVTSGIFVDPEGGRDFRSWVNWACVDPGYALPKMSAGLRYIAVAGSAITLLFIGVLLALTRFRRSRPGIHL